MDGATGSPGRHLELYAGVAAAHRAERAGDLVEPAYHEPAFPVIRRELRADNTRADWRAGLSGPGADLGRDPDGVRRTGTTGRADLCRCCGPAPASLEYVTGRWHYYLPTNTRRSWCCGRWMMFESSRQAAESARR